MIFINDDKKKTIICKILRECLNVEFFKNSSRVDKIDNYVN